MKINELVEKILTRVAMLTDIEIFVTDKEKLIYYLGNVDRVCEYLYSEISDDLKTLEDEKYEQKIEYVGEETISLLKCDMDKMQSEVICKFKEKGKFDIISYVKRLIPYIIEAGIIGIKVTLIK